MKRNLTCLLMTMCLMLMALPATSFALGTVQGCENPEGETFGPSQWYQFYPCAQTPRAWVRISCLSSTAMEYSSGSAKPYCRMRYESGSTGDGTWEGNVGSQKTLREPKKIEMELGTVKIMKVHGFVE